MVEILYPAYDRAVIITLLNLENYVESTVFNSIVHAIDKGNVAYILKNSQGIAFSAVIYCNEETSKKYLNLSYAYWISVEILKRNANEYITEQIKYRPGIDFGDTPRSLEIQELIKDSKTILNKIYSIVLSHTTVICVHIINTLIRTPELDTHGTYIASYWKYGKHYDIYSVRTSKGVNQILRESNLYNSQTLSKSDKYIDIKFLKFTEDSGFQDIILKKEPLCFM